jgi:SAM-dependent methyltransferase
MNYLQENVNFWNGTVEHHLQSEMYDVENFIAGKTSLKEIELALLPSLQQKSVLHLQCHFGQDTISLQRMGALCTGIDFSPAAILQAKKLNKVCEAAATFICSDIYTLPQIHEHSYDVVYSTYGTIGWLPDMQKWANIVYQYLKPGGTFIFAEFHPFVWMWDNDFDKITYSYFTDHPIYEVEEGSYASPKAPISAKSITWNHGMAEVISALLQTGLQLKDAQEYNYSPYNCLKGMKQIASQKFILEKFDNKLPLVYSLVFEKTL